MAETWHNLFSNALLFVALPCVCFFFTLYTIVALFQLLRDSFYRLLRIGGVSAVIFFVFWGFAMTNSGAYPTREDKERSRCAHAEADAELSLMGGLLVSGAAQPPLLDLSSALTVPAWKYGVYEDGVRVDFSGGWVFPFGTNHLASVEVMSWGEILLNGYSYSQIASFGPRLSMIPEISSFNYGPTSSNSYEFIWYNAQAGRIDGTQFDGRIELFRNGDILTVTNGVAVYKERELPSEWGDPSEDGFYGNDNLLPAGADSNAYYWVDLVVSNAAAKVKFAGDKESNYPDPEFIANNDSTNRVTLLIGKPYIATCDEAIGIVATSSDEIVVTRISENEISVVWPVEFDMEEYRLSSCALSRSTTQVPVAGGFSITSFPFLNGYYVWNTNACCAFASDYTDGVWSFSCVNGCGCKGCSFGGIFCYEGYWLDVTGLSCGCYYTEEPSVTASISFSKSAVIFENCYTNAPNDIVPRRSTTNSLDITIYGGPFGGSAEIEFDDKGKLEYLTQEAIPRSISVAAEQTLELSFPFTAKEESASENDIKASLKFTEYFTGDVIESEDEMTAVRVALVPQVEAVENMSVGRHKFGVCEKIGCKQYPNKPTLSWCPDGGGFISNGFLLYSCFYICPLCHAKDPLIVKYDSVCYNFLMEVFEPAVVKATNVVIRTYGVAVGNAGGIGMSFDQIILPLDVSFSMIAIEEVPSTNGTRSGYFDTHYFAADWYHTRENGAGVWGNVDVNNVWGEDQAAWTEQLLRMTEDGLLVNDETYRWKDGHIKWNIPYGWNINGTSGMADPYKIMNFNAEQRFEITDNGDVSVEKLGNIVIRTTNDWYYLNGVRVQ